MYPSSLCRILSILLLAATLVSCGGGGGSSNSSSTPSPVPAPPTPPPLQIPTKAESNADAARFLARSSFGVKREEVTALLNTDYENWLQQQFSIAPTFQLPKLDALLVARGYENINNSEATSQRQMLRSDAWFDTIVNGEDQLRQRVAFALGQILVVSQADSTVAQRVRGVASYSDVLIRHAFGNFRDLLEEVTLHPMMGNFLSMRRNEKGNDSGTIQPDENYAREVMQLFTIGLRELNADGSEKLDENDQPIDTYGQAEVRAFARVFTGWNYGDAPRLRSNQRTLDSEIIPMQAFQDFHDINAKTLLNGAVLPANQTAEQDLAMALDNLFEHPNVGPFIGKQLIQHLVTSNPSPAYVERVANTFNDNGAGVRGDLQAVVKSVLLDAEALLGHEADEYGFGKLKEPLYMLTSLWRAFDAQGVADRLRYYRGMVELGQQFLSAPSVFNFYLPSYSQPGIIDDTSMLSPEFQIVNESTIITTQNRLLTYVFDFNNGGSNERATQNKISINIDFEKTLAGDPAALVEHFNTLLFSGQLSQQSVNTLTDFITQTPLNDDGSQRVREGLMLALISPEFSFQR